jgi:uncharacterized RDD family membrane protein YckC
VAEIVTGEAVALDLTLAKLPSRLLAAIIDLALQLVLLWILVALVGTLLSDSDAAAAVSIVVVLLLFVGYPVMFETLSRGRTLGKMALGVRVVRTDAGPITFRHALVRGLAGIALEKPGLLFGLSVWIGILCMLLNRDGRRVGDLLAGTVVLQERVPAGQAALPLVPPPLIGWVTTLDLTGLDDGLALAVRQFLARAPRMVAAARPDLGARLAAAVAATITPPPPPGTPEWAYLAAVLAERRRRDTERYVQRHRPITGSGWQGPPLRAATARRGRTEVADQAAPGPFARPG